jgi:hypothetical protein
MEELSNEWEEAFKQFLIKGAEDDYCEDMSQDFMYQIIHRARHLVEEAYSQGKRDGRSVASFNSELERIKKEVRAETLKEVGQRIAYWRSTYRYSDTAIMNKIDDILTSLEKE